MQKFNKFVIVCLMLKTEEKQKIISKFRVHNTDTGSPQIQVAVITEEIKRLADHLKTHPKDNHSRRGLLKMVSKRKTLLDYLARKDENAYEEIVKKIGLKKKVK